jgi:hypothetical protein
MVDQLMETTMLVLVLVRLPWGMVVRAAQGL